MKTFKALLAMLVAAPCFAAPAVADTLTEVYAQILNDPANSELNLQYAMIAEGRGEYRKALAAYERILANDPDNQAAKRGLLRVRRILQPPFTRVTLETGAAFETNPLHESDGNSQEFIGFAKARILNEHTLGATRWRTGANIFADLHSENDELDYAMARVDTGPLVDIPGTMAAIRPALGGAVAALDGRFYYAEVNVSATVEGRLGGATQWVRLRGGYREYDPSSTADSGFYVDATGKWTRPDVFGEDDALSIAPWLRWSDMDGSIVDTALNEISPGRYFAGGARVEYDKALNDWFAFGIFVAISDRLYTTDTAPDGDKRQDFLFSPGVTLLFDDVLGPQTDLRFEYAYENNDSNDPAHDYENHEIVISVSKRL